MTTSEHDRDALAAYVLGGLDERAKETLETHLEGCEACRREREVLAEVGRLLGEVPPEAFLDGPPDDADLLEQRTLTRIRAEAARGRFRRQVLVAAAACLLLAIAFGTGTLIGQNRQEPGTVAQPTLSRSATPSLPAPGTVVASGVDAASGAAMTVRVTPAIGWVRVTAAVRGIPAGERCRLWVVARDGTRELAGSWLVSQAAAREGTTLDGAAAVPPEEVAAVEVTNVAGRRFVSVGV